MGLKVNVSITSATGIGGVYPFVVVCFDGDLSNELYKTPATNSAPTCTWNSTFQLDLTTQIKAHIAAGNPEPKYMTFFIFDTGAQGVPSLGSAGVLLKTVHESGVAQGDFQVVNGKGTLSLVVSNVKRVPEGEEEHAWYKTNAAKIAAGTGVAAVAAGLGGLALHQVKKKKKQKAGDTVATRELVDSDDDEEEDQGQKPDRPWYDPGNSSSGQEEGNEEEEHDYHAYEAEDGDDE